MSRHRRIDPSSTKDIFSFSACQKIGLAGIFPPALWFLCRLLHPNESAVLWSSELQEWQHAKILVMSTKSINHQFFGERNN